MQLNKKIAFISHSHHFNGAEICLLETVRSLIRYGGNEVHVVVPGKKESYLGNELIKAGAIVHPLIVNPRWVDYKLPAGQRINWMKQSFRAFIEFWRFLRKEKPDMVISNSIVNNPALALAAKMLGHRFAWYIHELGDLDHGYTFYAGKKTTFSYIRLMSDKIIFNSQFTFRHFMGDKKINPRKMAVIDYIVDAARLSNDAASCNSDKFSNISNWEILIAGRTAEGKGQEDLVHAAGLLKNKYGIQNFHVTVLGKVAGAYNDKLMHLIEQYELAGFVDLVPFINDPSIYFQKAHIGVTTSRNEAFGRITVEYMKSNMITIGAKAGATGEIITDQETGIMYELKNYEELAAILYNIITGKTDVQKLQQNACAESNKRFSEEKHATSLSNFLFS